MLARALDIHEKDGYGQLRADTDPASIEPAVAEAGRPFRLQFDEPLPNEVLIAAAGALRRYPDVELRAYGRQLGPSLAWLSGFEDIQHLSLQLWNATSFDMLAAFTSLRSLTLGQTLSRRPSLAFVRGLPQLGVLWLEAHARDFDAVGEVETLTRLHLRVPRARSLEPLRGHPSLEVLTMDFGGIRDLSCLKDIPRLRGLGLYQVRKLDTGDLDAVGDCAELEAVSLGALRNVASLRAFAQGPRSTLRLLTLERLPALATLADLANCKRLEQLGLYDSRPADGRLDHLLGCPALKHLVASDRYPRDQPGPGAGRFRGKTLQLRGEPARGDLGDVAVRWRAPVHRQLDADGR